MVLPEGSPNSGPERPGSNKVVFFGVALLVLSGAILMLARATTPGEEAAVGTSTTTSQPFDAPTTTTTIDVDSFSIRDIATDGRFSWVKAPPLGRLWPIDLIEHDGSIFLFGSQMRDELSGGGVGLEAWVSDDGIGWRSLGKVVGPTHRVHRVVSAGDRMVALGTRIDSGAPVAWSSSDGLAWLASSLPIEAEPPAGSFFRMTAAVEFQGRLVVTGAMFSNALEQVASSLPEDLVGSDRSNIDLGFTLRPDGGIVEVYGPLGLHAFSMRTDELGLDDLTESDLFGPQPPATQFVWTSNDGVRWERTELDGAIVQEIWVRPDDVLVAYGSGERGTVISTSSDARNWEKHARSSRAWIFRIGAHAAWGDWLIGGGLGEDLFLTDDGLDWEFLGTGALLPDAINWNISPVQAGEAGLVAVASALRANNAPTFTPVIIEKDGAVVTVDIESGWVTVESGLDAITIPLWATGISDLVDVDFIEGRVTFKHPDTEERLLSLDFATLERAESSAIKYGPANRMALLFTPDGEEWSIQDLSEEIGTDTVISSMEVLSDRVVLLTYPITQGETSSPPTIAIRVAFIR